MPWEDLDPAMVQEIQRANSGYTLDVLKNQLRPGDTRESTLGGDQYVVSDTVAPNSPCRVPNPDVVSECRLSELPSSIHLGGSSCMVKNDGKGRKMTGFQSQKIIVVLMDISGPSRTRMAK